MRQGDRRWGGRFARRSQRDESGASLVEFALVLPVFALLLFGLIDFGLIFGSYITMRNGVEAGARNASVSDYALPSGASCSSTGLSGSKATATANMVCDVVASIGSLQAVTSSGLVVGVTFPSGSSLVGQNVEVCAQGTMKSVTGITGFALNGKHMSSSSTVRLEHDAAFSNFDASTPGATVKYTPASGSATTVSPWGCS